MSDPRADLLRAGYATVAKAYADQLIDELAGKPLDRAWLTAFVSSCPGGAGRDLIVDVGCGPGHVTHFLAASGANVEGLDLSPEMIADARSSFPALTFRVGDMFALPYADGSVAGIAAFYAIVHVPTAELLAPFREFYRVLVPGGLTAIAFHAGAETVHVDELFGCATSLDFVFHSPEVVVAALREVGFSLEARLDRRPYQAEHPSERTYLLARK